MKAIVYERYGPPDVLEFKEVETPSPKDDEVLIKVKAASINSWDWDLLTGKPRVYRLMFGMFKPKLKILGADVAGIIKAVGKSVKQFHAGDEVFGDLSEGNWGCFAEYVCAKENALTLKSANMTFEQAASIPQAALLALQGLRYRKQLQNGQKILINGAGGGVGTFAIQIAKAFGTEVTGVDSTNKLDTMRSLGADQVIDYTKEDFTRNGNQYDLVLDVMARRSIFDYRRALNPTGTFAMIGGSVGSIFQAAFLGSFLSMFGNKKMGLVVHKPNIFLDDMKEMFNSGKVVPVIDRCYPLSETAEAFRYFGGGDVKGKVVITV